MPTKRSVEFDHHTSAWVEDPYRVYDRLRADEPLAHTDAHGGFWLLSRYEDVAAALRDVVRFSSAHPGRVAIPHTNPGLPGIPIEVDPPEHGEYRKVVSPYFARPAVERLSDLVGAKADGLIDGFIEHGRCDLVNEFAAPILAETLSTFFGLPCSDVPRIERWSDAIFANRLRDPEGATRAQAELESYLVERLDDRRAHPGDDVLSAIVTATVDGRPLTDRECLGFFRILLIAGREATIDAMANITFLLAHDPELEAAVRREDDLFFAIEELLRFDPPIQLLGRVATCPIELRGRTIPPGASVAMLYASANRDSDQFADADRPDIARRPNPHLSFGAGRHHCLGNNLARMVLRVSIGRLLARTADLSLDDVEPPRRKPNGDARGFVRLPIRFSRS